MITEDYVSFETAKLLKEKVFEEGCRQYWYKGNIVFSRNEIRNGELDNYEDKGWTAPTLQMVMKWLREVYELYIEISLSCDREDKNAKIFDTSIFNVQNQRYKKLSNIQGYEQACESAILYCLQNLI